MEVPIYLLLTKLHQMGHMRILVKPTASSRKGKQWKKCMFSFHIFECFYVAVMWGFSYHFYLFLLYILNTMLAFHQVSITPCGPPMAYCCRV